MRNKSRLSWTMKGSKLKEWGEQRGNKKKRTK